MPKARTEYVQYIAPDGGVYDFHTRGGHVGRWVESVAGWGTPPIEYIRNRAPFQHGETVVDFFLRPRVIQLMIRQQYCNRDDWWTGRGDLLAEIRPNNAPLTGAGFPYTFTFFFDSGVPLNPAPGRLRWIEADGTLRDLDVFILSGPIFTPHRPRQWDEWGFREMLRFIAYNPVVYDPAQQEVTFVQVSADELVFPITFDASNIIFDSSTLIITQTIRYVGTWEEYPIITITGPLSNPIITNTTTNEKIQINRNILAGEHVIIDLRFGFKTVELDDGTNIIGDVSTDSDLTSFHLEPDPGAVNGDNVITATGGTAVPGVTEVRLHYFTRYFGI